MTLPRPLNLLWNGWKRVGHAIGRVMSFVILTVVWVVAIGAYAIVLKVVALFRTKEQKTYWKSVPPQEPDNLKYQF